MEATHEPAPVEHKHEKRIAALLQHLHETEDELRRLTGGDLDSVATASGGSYLFRDAQERLQRSEAALQRSEALLRNAQRIANIGSWEMDIVHNGLVWSENMFDIFGVDPADFQEVYENYSSLVHPEDWPRVQASSAAARSKADGNMLDLEYRILRPDGEVRTIYERGEIVFDDQGRPVSAAGVMMDITERRTLEEGYRSLFEQSAVGMGTISKEGGFLSANKKLCEIVGYSEEELRSLTPMDITHPDDREPSASEIERLLRGEVETSSWDKRYVRKDGSIVWANLTLSRLNGGAGGAVFSGVVRDITERKRTTSELERISRALRMLSRCNEALIRAESESALLDEVCKIAVDIGGYRMSSVLYAQDDEQKTMLAMSHAGFDEDYFSGITISWADDSPYGRGPVGRVIRSGKAVVVPDLTSDPDYAPWVRPASQRGYRSVIALPLRGGDRTFGVFGLYSPEPRDVSRDEVALLHELADDLAFGIVNLRLRQERQSLLKAVTAVSQVASASIGSEFFQNLLLSLVDALGAYAGTIVETKSEDKRMVQTICAVVDGKLVPNFEYARQGTPCEDVHQAEVLVIERDAQKRYPHLKSLADMRIEAYVGTNLIDAAGQRIGTIFVLFQQPLAQSNLAASMLRLFASRVAAEMLRQKSDARLREQAMLLDKAKEAIFVRDLDHRIVHWNHGAEHLYGWSAEEAIGRSVLGMKVRDEAAFLAAQEKLLRTGEWNGELTERTKDGRTLIVECHWTLVRPEDGAASRILVINTDITERKRSEEHLRLLEAAVARLNDIIVITEAEPISQPGPRIVFVNDAFERQTGYMRAEVIGKSPRILQGPKTSREERNRIREALQKKEPVSAELINYTKDRKEFWAEIEIVPLINADGVHTHWVSVKRDITERKRSEALLQESEARLVQSQKLESIGHLTGGIAHDFNNLLTVILGNSEMLAEELAENPRLLPLAEMIRVSGQRGAELTNRLLAFARKQALEPKLVCPGQIAQDMLAMLQRTLGENIRVEVFHDADLWPVFIDPGQLESAILNLCINARDSMPQGGHLLIEASNVVLDQSYSESNLDVLPGEYVMLAVSDTGTGIPPAILERVFDPFFTTKPKGKGTGLGLSMVYGFTKQSGGNVKIYSEEGVGTVVKLYMPRSDGARTTSVATVEQVLDLRGKETILLVEDDDMVREHAVHLLAELGYHVLVAADGRQALEIARGGAAFDLLFTDVMMPGGWNGPQLAAEIEKIRPGIPVLFTSGYTENAIVHYGRVDPGVNLLHKPYTRRKMAEKIRQTLRDAGTDDKE
ncbi:MAG: PAS domain S-box protein [Acidobacteriaceae bacterium]